MRSDIGKWNTYKVITGTGILAVLWTDCHAALVELRDVGDCMKAIAVLRRVLSCTVTSPVLPSVHRLTVADHYDTCRAICRFGMTTSPMLYEVAYSLNLRCAVVSRWSRILLGSSYRCPSG